MMEEEKQFYQRESSRLRRERLREEEENERLIEDARKLNRERRRIVEEEERRRDLEDKMAQLQRQREEYLFTERSNLLPYASVWAPYICIGKMYRISNDLL